MRKFWGYAKNENFKVGCNGGSIFVYDKEDKELTRFKGLHYAYSAKFMPGSNIVVVKTNEGQLFIYDLDKLELVKRIVAARDTSQDTGFAFSPDGKWLYNIERQKGGVTQLAIYNTDGFILDSVINKGNRGIHLADLEFDEETGRCFVVGYLRREDGVYKKAFVGEIMEGTIEILEYLHETTYDYVRDYKHWEESGFSEKSLEVLYYLKVPKIKPVKLKDIALKGWRPW